MSRVNVAVFFGGTSVEHEISVITALQLFKSIDSNKYNVVPVYISQPGVWYSGEELKTREYFQTVVSADKPINLDEVALIPGQKSGNLTILKSASRSPFRSREIKVDVCFPVIHGTGGEDGTLQGLFELAQVPYTGCGVLAASLAMNKWACKRFVADAVPVLPGYLVTRDAYRANASAVENEIFGIDQLSKFPLIVKPCSLGSSIGVGPASDIGSLRSSLADAFRYDEAALVEPMITNLTEINVSVLEGNPPVATVIEVPRSKGILTYDDKYMSGAGSKKQGGSSEGMAALDRDIDPDFIPEATKLTVREMAVRIYSLLNCAGISRIDFMMDNEANQVYFNEINILPGSLSFYLWQASKPSLLYPELVDRLIEGAIARHGSAHLSTRNMGFQALTKSGS